MAQIGELIDRLPDGRAGLFNPYRDACEHDAPGNGPEARRARLAQHLDCDARLILVGEAPGYAGARYTGLSFTSERLLIEGAIPRVPRCDARLTTRHRPFSEPSATIVWKHLYLCGVAEITVMWNALQLHPSAGLPWTNRTPTRDEIALGRPALTWLAERYPRALFVAVGRHAEAALTAAGIAVHASVRHPANGGATAFGEGLADAVRHANLVEITRTSP